MVLAVGHGWWLIKEMREYVEDLDCNRSGNPHCIAVCPAVWKRAEWDTLYVYIVVVGKITICEIELLQHHSHIAITTHNNRGARPFWILFVIVHYRKRITVYLLFTFFFSFHNSIIGYGDVCWPRFPQFLGCLPGCVFREYVGESGATLMSKLTEVNNGHLVYLFRRSGEEKEYFLCWFNLS